MRILCSFLLACCFLLGTLPDTVRAQDPLCQPIAQGPLASLEGTWDVDWRYRRIDGTYHEGPATSTITTDLAGCMLSEVFTATLDGTPYHARTFISQPKPDAFDRVIIDALHGGFMRTQGFAVGDTLVFTWQFDPGDGRVIQVSHRYFGLTPDTFETDRYTSPDLGAPWRKVQAAVYRRRQ